MNRNLLKLSGIVLMLVSVSLITGCGKKAKLILPDKNNGGITLPEKFGAVVVVDTLGRGRHPVRRCGAGTG